MILAPHAVAGAVAALFFRRQPLLGFIVAFASHFALDAIPHWHYRVNFLHRDPHDRSRHRMHMDRFSRTDLARISIDGLLGLALAFAVVRRASFYAMTIGVVGAILGMLPDALQLLYHLFPRLPLRHFALFHSRIHAKVNLDSLHVRGVAMQGAMIFLFMLLSSCIAFS